MSSNAGGTEPLRTGSGLRMKGHVRRDAPAPSAAPEGLAPGGLVLRLPRNMGPLPPASPGGMGGLGAGAAEHTSGRGAHRPGGGRASAGSDGACASTTWPRGCRGRALPSAHCLATASGDSGHLCHPAPICRLESWGPGASDREWGTRGAGGCPLGHVLGQPSFNRLSLSHPVGADAAEKNGVCPSTDRQKCPCDTAFLLTNFCDKEGAFPSLGSPVTIMAPLMTRQPRQA